MLLRLLLTTTLLAGLFPAALRADYRWAPFPVQASQTSQPSTDPIPYYPLSKAERPWTVCVSLPHLKDSVWVAVNYGIADEARRLKVRMRLFEAGGYENQAMQRQQIERCIADGAEALIVGSISLSGLGDLVSRLHAKQIPVIDIINGMDSPLVASHVAIPPLAMGEAVGRYMLAYIGKNKAAKVALFPGPRDAGWAIDNEKGLRAALKGSALTIVTTRYGDTGLATQRALLQDVLAQHPDIDYIVGTAVTVEAAIPLLRERGLSQRIGLFADYFTEGTYSALRNEQMLAAVSDSPVVLGRIALDQAIRHLEGRSPSKRISPQPRMYNHQNLNEFERLNSLAPRGFLMTFDVN